MKPSNSTQTQTKKGKVMENQINSQVQQFYQFWKSAASEQAAFLESFYQELGKAQSSAVAQFNANFDEAVRLGKQALEQGQQVVAQWRQFAIEASRQSADRAAPHK